MEAVMNSQRGLFLSGLILGLGVGLLLSHFLHPAHHEMTSAGLQIPTPAIALPPVFPANLPVSMPSVGDAYFPELEHDAPLQEPPPLQNALAVETSHGPFKQAADQLIRDQPHQPMLPKSEPEQLQVGDAVPLSQNTERDQQIVHGIIEIELAHLPEDKRQVWFDALKDVNKEDVAGILKMWKLLGGPIPEAPMGMLPETVIMENAENPFSAVTQIPAKNEPQPHSPKDWDALITQAEEILRRNQFMQETAGYIPQIPVFTELPMGELSLVAREDFAAVRHVPTNFPLDLAILGPGFFVVSNAEGNRFFTRRGALTVSPDRKLAIKPGSQCLTLLPEITIPVLESGNALQIDELGVVWSINTKEDTTTQSKDRRQLGQIELALPWQSDELTSAGNGLYQLNNTREQHFNRLPLTPEGTSLKPGFLEYPAFAETQMTNQLKRLKQLKDFTQSK